MVHLRWVGANPWVVASLFSGAALLFAFPFIEKRVAEPLFNLNLFKNREFATANIATFLSSISRGGVMVMLVVLLQGIWLPLHGYSYDSTPFWAGIFMLPMSIGIALTGPFSGWLSDKHGARVLATAGMIITGVGFLVFTLLPANFEYLPFALILFVLGIGNGIFMSPNMASVMNSCPPEHQRRSFRHACQLCRTAANHQPSNLLCNNHNFSKRHFTCCAFNCCN